MWRGSHRVEVINNMGVRQYFLPTQPAPFVFPEIGQSAFPQRGEHTYNRVIKEIIMIVRVGVPSVSGEQRRLTLSQYMRQQ